MIIPRSIGFMYRGTIPLPAAKVCFRTFYFHDFLKHMVITWNWNIVGRDPLVVKIGRSVLRITPQYFDIMFSEWLAWEKWYLPKFPLRNLTILDVGAGCGETALFFFLKGAKKVICVEPDSNLVAYLRENARTNRWNLDIVPRAFDLSMLDLRFDFMKMDGEGCEADLLRAEILPSCAIEVHDSRTLKALMQRFRLEVVPQKQGLWIARVSGPISVSDKAQSQSDL